MTAVPQLRSAMLAIGISLAAIGPALGGSIYLKLPNVTGPVTGSGFSGDIALTAYSQSITNPATSISSGGAASQEQPSCGAIKISKLVDSSSQEFLEYVTRGTEIPTVTVYFTGGNPNATPTSLRYTIVLTNVRVTSVSQGDTASNTASLGITENISMVAEKFQVTYATSSPDALKGNTETYGWDCATNNPT
jgi:type VI protein secretion system component Hcp